MSKKPITTRRARNILVHGNQADREHVLEELGKLATSEITDVLFWDAEGRVTLQGSADLIIKKIKEDKKLNEFLNNKNIQKKIFIPNKLINIVTN